MSSPINAEAESADLERIVQGLRADVGCQAAFVTMLINERQLILAHSSNPMLTEDMLSFRIEFSVCQHAVASRSRLIVDDASGHALLRQNLGVREIGIGAYAGTPIFVGGDVAASICAIEFAPRTWRPQDIEALERAALDAATCLMMDRLPVESAALPILAHRPN